MNSTCYCSKINSKSSRRYPLTIKRKLSFYFKIFIAVAIPVFMYKRFFADLSNHEKVLLMIKENERREAFTKIFSDKLWGANEESVSGNGSSKKYTENTRKLLEKAINKLGIKSIDDAPCGDCNWQPLIKGFSDLYYIGIDIVPSLIDRNLKKFSNETNMKFLQMDISNSLLPSADLLLCRDMIQHNSLEDGYRTFMNIEASGIKYLATNWHLKSTKNSNIHPGSWYDVDVFLPPFNFSKPLFFIKEGPNGKTDDEKMLGVWKLPALGMGDGKKFVIEEEILAESHSSPIELTMETKEQLWNSFFASSQ